MGKLYAVGFGPGGYEHMTAKAIDVIKNADIITGYTTYVEMLKKFFPEKEYVATPMTKEMDRCRMAVDLAAEGKTVAMVSSGDSGIYGMAGILLEIANEKKADVEIETVPGVTAASAAASIPRATKSWKPWGLSIPASAPAASSMPPVRPIPRTATSSIPAPAGG